MDAVRKTLALMEPRDIYPLWRCVDLQERMGIISADEAAQWKQGVFELMVFYELEPGGLASDNFDPISRLASADALYYGQLIDGSPRHIQVSHSIVR